MKLIHRYLLKELGGPFIFGFLFFNFVLLVGALFDLMELIFTEQAPIGAVGKLIVLSLPSFFYIVIPIAFLFGVILSFGRLSSQGEMIAFRCAGIRIFWFVQPVFILSFLLTGISLLASLWLTPWCNVEYKNTYSWIMKQRPTLKLEEGLFTSLENKKFYIQKLDKERGKMEGVIIYEFFPSSPFPQFSWAEKGEVEEGKVELRQILTYRFDRNLFLRAFGEFEEQKLYLTQPEVRKEEKETKEMSIWEIRMAQKKELEKEKPNLKRLKELSVDFHSRFSIPIATFFLTLIGIPLGIKIERGERSISLGASLAVIIAYYILFLTGKVLVRGGFLSPFIGMWFSNFIMGGVGLFSLFKITRA